VATLKSPVRLEALAKNGITWTSSKIADLERGLFEDPGSFARSSPKEETAKLKALLRRCKTVAKAQRR
jgi:hypothetical protein